MPRNTAGQAFCTLHLFNFLILGITRLAAPDVGLSQNAYFFTAELGRVAQVFIGGYPLKNGNCKDAILPTKGKITLAKLGRAAQTVK